MRPLFCRERHGYRKRVLPAFPISKLTKISPSFWQSSINVILTKIFVVIRGSVLYNSYIGRLRLPGLPSRMDSKDKEWNES